ncbi:MAG: hypothetical protein JNM84_08855 [Planctomycetes bacterium]|nr:hypothetical protein [Planctomycetota bacterium]
MSLLRLPLLLAAMCAASAVPAQQKEEPELSWRIVLRSGAYLNGQLLRQDALEIELVDREGNQVVVERELVARVECLKGTVTAKVGELEIEERDRVEARDAGARATRRAVATLSDAEVVQRAFGELAAKLQADDAQPFAPEELGRGRWKWSAPGQSTDPAGFTYATERPSVKQVREIGSLIFHLERDERAAGIAWVPYRWDPKRADWTLRAHCPPALRLYRELVEQRALLDRQAEALARVDARWRSLPPAEAKRAQEQRLLEQTREGYEEVLRRYLANAERARAFVKAKVALPALDGAAGKEGALR